jgi:hypothetical protein
MFNFHIGSPAKVLLELSDDGDLLLLALVQTSQLVIELHSNV